MRNTVVKFGLIAGGILAATMAVTLPLMNSGKMEHSYVVGYTSMVVALLAVFFGIRSYRDKNGGGTITFGKAFKVGILITVIASAIYVIAWEIIYFNFVPDFADKYAALSIEKLRSDGASDAEILAEQQKMADFKRLYANPLINVGMTFMEVFPVGLIVTLVSAAILRKKPTPGFGSRMAEVHE